VQSATDALEALSRSVDGFDGVMTMTSGGVRLWADLLGPDPKASGQAVAALLTGENLVLRRMRGGPPLARLGSRTVGETAIEEFSAGPLPPPDAASGPGDRVRLGMGVAGDRLRLCLGTEIDVNGRFGLTVSRPLAQVDDTRTALAALPSNANIVILIDPARLAPLFSRLRGTGPIEPPPAGPPIAISFTLVGKPARIDIHVPLQALNRVRQALHPSQKL
jgi:hypothetical protein